MTNALLLVGWIGLVCVGGAVAACIADQPMGRLRRALHKAWLGF